MLGYLFVLFCYSIYMRESWRAVGQSQVPASVRGEGQNGITRPVRDPSSLHAAGQPPLGQQVLTWSDWAEVPHSPLSLPYISRLAFREDRHVGCLTSEPLRGALGSPRGQLLSWLHPDENALRPPSASESAAPGGLPLSDGKGEE